MESKLSVTLIQHTPEPEKTIAAAAKLCYSHSGAKDIMADLTPEAVEKFLNRLVSMGHASPVEHATFTFAIEGVSRSLTHQLVRHRMASFSQQSQRYVSEKSSFDYVVPPEIAEIPAAKEEYLRAMENAQASYDILADLLIEKHKAGLLAKGMNEKQAASAAEKMGIEDARYVLPNGCETKIVVTMNVRELLHFFNVRCCSRAQWEIRECATQMLAECKKIAPILFSHAGPNCVEGPCPEGIMTCGKAEEVRAKFKAL
ncbi:FAD-dependent thymidylate synthase [Eubacterium barkeri]|uniref:Flavin-dependent thymidylate synthase n=1 Tax=Eubacterium barkeri TaxID=1528 RepID=A0A1H3EHD8_EUBBA|nr:FAD-dependent thymidylate synthase [Eubacterium barkeri]SDX78017.1 thymidylate synthase (FAD) [Eubacterium barkeri]